MENDLNKCKRCGQCMSVCPVYLTTFREDDVARGKLALLESVEAGTMNRSQRFEQILSRCLLCGACAEVCSNQVQTNRIMQAGRHRLFELEKKDQAESALLKAVREALNQADSIFAFPCPISREGARSRPLSGSHSWMPSDWSHPLRQTAPG